MALMVAWNELFRGNGRHTLKLGMRGDNDEVLYSERCRKKAEFLGVVKHTFSYDCGKGERITAVIAYDEWSDDTGGDPEVLSGGVGRDHVTIKVTSERNRGFHFLFEVYGTKAKERPTKSNTSGRGVWSRYAETLFGATGILPETTRPKPHVQKQHLPDQEHVPSGQYGEYLSGSTRNIQTVYDHWKLAEVHKLGITGKGTTIAIIDDGLNRSHLSVKNRCARGEISGFQDWHHDKAEHGTAVAAIAAGEGYHNIPPGIAPEASLYIYRLGKDFGAKELSAALDHILLKQDIDVVAMSLCLPKKSEKIEGQLAELAKKKVVCVAAAGNSGSLQSGVKFPANDSNVISVGALKETGQVSYLNPDGGSDIDVYAFGEGVLAPSLTAADATSNLDGSSYAVPMVAGFLSLLIQCAKSFPHCTEDVQAAYHSVKFLKHHFHTCYELCDDQRRLLRVGNYFKNLYEYREQSPSRLVKYYREVYN